MVESEDPAPQLIFDPITNRPILMSPVRRRRPIHTGSKQGEKPCPFCPGNEAETPPELDAISRAGEGHKPGWTVRAFANKYPAYVHHEVIAEGHDHHDHPSDLDRSIWRAALELWQRRIAALEMLPDVSCAYLFKNVGAFAGASIAHNHTQILGLPQPPPRLLLEAEGAKRLGACPWCATLASAQSENRLIFQAPAHVVLTPDPPKLPNETWLLPRTCDDDFLTTDLDSLALAVHTLFQVVGRSLDRPALNFWLHRIPGTSFHWHFELQPRTGQVAGLELGGDMYINSYTAQMSAAKLRQGLEP